MNRLQILKKKQNILNTFQGLRTLKFLHNLPHCIWWKYNECAVQYNTVLYSTVQAYMPALTLLRDNCLLNLALEQHCASDIF